MNRNSHLTRSFIQTKLQVLEEMFEDNTHVKWNLGSGTTIEVTILYNEKIQKAMDMSKEDAIEAIARDKVEKLYSIRIPPIITGVVKPFKFKEEDLINRSEQYCNELTAVIRMYAKDHYEVLIDSHEQLLKSVKKVSKLCKDKYVTKRFDIYLSQLENIINIAERITENKRTLEHFLETK